MILQMSLVLMSEKYKIVIEKKLQKYLRLFILKPLQQTDIIPDKAEYIKLPQNA
jgi:hypothetical protein